MAGQRAILVLVWVGLLAGAGQAQPLTSGLALLSGLHSFHLRETEPLPDPFPLRRVLLTEQAPLPATPPGDPFRPMPRAEFERLVRQAARRTTVKPTLVQAMYRARFDGDALSGSGEWIVSSTGEGVLPLAGVQVALREPRWNDGREAWIGGTPANLWVDHQGRVPLRFEWSARGIEEPAAVRFDLSLLPAPLAMLELDLPRDRVPVVKAGQLLTGPVPTNESAGHLAESLSGASRGSISRFAIRPVRAFLRRSGPPPVR